MLIPGNPLFFALKNSLFVISFALCLTPLKPMSFFFLPYSTNLQKLQKKFMTSSLFSKPSLLESKNFPEQSSFSFTLPPIHQLETILIRDHLPQRMKRVIPTSEASIMPLELRSKTSQTMPGTVSNASLNFTLILVFLTRYLRNSLNFFLSIACS